MVNDDIALNFDKLEYYSLQEACDYLNRKYKINNITPKKLLKRIYDFEVNAYIYFQSYNSEEILFDFDYYEDNIFPRKSNNEKTQLTLNEMLKISDDIRINILKYLVDEVFVGRLMFQVSDYLLLNMSLNSKQKTDTRSFIFEGLLSLEELNANPRKPSILKECSVVFNNKTYEIYDITNISLKLKETDRDKLLKLTEEYPYPCIFDIRDDFSFIEFILTIDDLIILHHDLELLEKNIIENSKPPKKDNDKEVRFLQSRQGISKGKLLAKELANHIAKTEWEKDKEQKINVSEMVHIVWNGLIDSTLQGYLPNNIQGIRNWIDKDIIPSYASKAGRPKQK